MIPIHPKEHINDVYKLYLNWYEEREYGSIL